MGDDFGTESEVFTLQPVRPLGFGHVNASGERLHLLLVHQILLESQIAG